MGKRFETTIKRGVAKRLSPLGGYHSRDLQSVRWTFLRMGSVMVGYQVRLICPKAVVLTNKKFVKCVLRKAASIKILT